MQVVVVVSMTLYSTTSRSSGEVAFEAVTASSVLATILTAAASIELLLPLPLPPGLLEFFGDELQKYRNK